MSRATAALLLFVLTPHLPAAAPASSLSRVAAIHLGELTGDLPERAVLVRKVLTDRLEAGGLKIVQQPADADASLTAEVSITIVVDGDERDRPRDSYRFTLTSSGGQALWRGRVYVDQAQRLEQEAGQVGRQIANKLLKARQKAQKLAKRNTGL